MLCQARLNTLYDQKYEDTWLSPHLWSFPKLLPRIGSMQLYRASTYTGALWFLFTGIKRLEKCSIVTLLWSMSIWFWTEPWPLSCLKQVHKPKALNLKLYLRYDVKCNVKCSSMDGFFLFFLYWGTGDLPKNEHIVIGYKKIIIIEQWSLKKIRKSKTRTQTIEKQFSTWPRTKYPCNQSCHSLNSCWSA